MPYKPKLNLSFNPPITTEAEYTDVINLLNAVYPGLKWYSGKYVTDANMFRICDCGFYSFNIGYFPEEPNRLTYTSRPLETDEEFEHEDGRQWVKDHTVDTDNIFNQLYESKSAENTTKNYRPKLLLSFDPLIETVESLNKVLDVLDAVYPGLTWVNNKSVLTYNTFEQEMDNDSFIGTLTIGFWEEQPDQLSWGGSREGDETYDYELYEDGWRWVGKYTPNVDDAFSKLYESKRNYDFLYDSDLTGLQFYLPREGITYTFTKPAMARNGDKYWFVKWIKKDGRETEQQENIRIWLDLVNEGFYILTGSLSSLPSSDDIFNKLNESENEVDYNFLRTQDVLSLQFYNPREYEESRTVYTIIDADDDELKLKWNGGRGSLDWDDFIDNLNTGFYFIKDDDVKTTIDNFNTLFESEGVRTIHRGDKVYVPIWRQIGTIEAIIGNNGSYKKITEISPGICAKSITFSINLDETGRQVYLSRGQFEFPKMSSEDAFSKLYESEDDFDWAKQLVNAPITLGYLWEKDALSKGDEIALYGEIKDSEKVLFQLTGEEFKVDRVTYKRDVYSGNGTGEIDTIKLEWLTSLSDRPNNWRTASTGNYFEVSSSTIKTDGLLRVEYITPPQEKINEGDDLDWAREILQQEPTPSKVKLGTGKRFVMPHLDEYNKDWQIFDGWYSWHPVIRTDYMFGVMCYVVNLSNDYDQTYVPIEDIKTNEKEFNTNINESEEDFEWVKDIAPPDSVDSDLWVVKDSGHYYPENIMLWDYFNIPGVRKCITGQDGKGEPIGDRKCTDELYRNGVLITPNNGDECYHDTKLWTGDTYFSQVNSLPIHHMIRVKDGGHFVMTNNGAKRIR